MTLLMDVLKRIESAQRPSHAGTIAMGTEPASSIPWPESPQQNGLVSDWSLVPMAPPPEASAPHAIEGSQPVAESFIKPPGAVPDNPATPDPEKSLAWLGSSEASPQQSSEAAFQQSSEASPRQSSEANSRRSFHGNDDVTKPIPPGEEPLSTRVPELPREDMTAPEAMRVAKSMARGQRREILLFGVLPLLLVSVIAGTYVFWKVSL
ncbi:MAG: hypothetical protein KJO08_05580 [Gammaproteobacteria bacterium]|nr:hypothetical protein [Gammaproteobacteria bacterium]